MMLQEDYALVGIRCRESESESESESELERGEEEEKEEKITDEKSFFMVVAQSYGKDITYLRDRLDISTFVCTYIHKG